MMASDRVGLFVCDDNENVRQALVRMLGGTGDIDVLGEAGSTEELLGLLDSGTADAVLLDVNLPGLSGIEGVSRLREAGYHEPIVMMSADRRNEGPARAAGAAGFYYKGGADAADLTAVIRDAVAAAR